MKDQEMGKPAKAIPQQNTEHADAFDVIARMEAGLRYTIPANTSTEERSPYLPANRC